MHVNKLHQKLSGLSYTQNEKSKKKYHKNRMTVPTKYKKELIWFVKEFEFTLLLFEINQSVTNIGSIQKLSFFYSVLPTC